MAVIDNTLAAQVPTFDPATPLMEGAKIQAAQQEIQQAKFKQNQTEMGAEMRGLAPFVNSPEFPAKWREAADKLRQRGVIDDQMHEQWANAPSPLLMKSIIAKTDSPEMALNKEKFAQEQSNTKFSQGIQTQQLGLLKRAADRADDPTPDNFVEDKTAPGGYRPIGPADPAYKASVAKAEAEAKADVPTIMGSGSSVVIPSRAGTDGAIFTNKPSGGLTETARDIRARQVINGDYSGLTNIGKGAQAGRTLEEISNRAAEILTEEGGMSSTEAAAHMSKKLQEFKASGIYQNTEARTSASREANLNLILKATDAAIPAALEASEAVDRTGWVPLNKIIQKGEVIASSPELKKFGMANLQLAEHWARAMNPTGVMRESDRDMALGFLSTADSKDTYKQAVGQLKTQITRERDAVRASRGGGGAQPDSTSAPAGAVAALKSNPALKAQFEAKYGAGSAARALANTE